MRTQEFVSTHSAAVMLRERRRLESLGAYSFADAQRAPAIQTALTEHARSALELAGGQFATVNIVGERHQLTIAGTDGVPLARVDRDQSICSHILYASGPGHVFATGDATLDPDLWDHPSVTGVRGGIRFFAGAALIGREGLPLGMLCVFSAQPLSDADAERAGMRLLPVRDRVVAVLESHRDGEDLLVHRMSSKDHLSTELAQLIAATQRLPINAVIDDGAVRTLFQPIVHLESGTVAGFEALSRGPMGTELESPIALLNAARAVGRLGELDWLCRASAMRAAAASGLPAELSWFINVEPAGLEIECPQHLRPVLDHARAGLRVVLEVVERDVEDNVTRLLHATDQARQDAWGVALDDVGAQVGSLALLPFLQPDVVKLDMSLLREAPSATASEVTAAVRAYAERTGAVILAEGIETPEQADLARIFGATYGQGYLYGRPASLPRFLSAPAGPIPLRQKVAPLGGATPFEVLQATTNTQRGRPDQLRHIASHLLRYCERAEDGAVLLTLFNSRATYLEHRTRLDAVAVRNALTVCLVPDLPAQPTSSRHNVGPLPAGSRLVNESALIVVSPYFSGVLVIRETDQTDANGAALVDFIYTHDRTASIAAARAYLEHMIAGTARNSGSLSKDEDCLPIALNRRARVVAHLASSPKSAGIRSDAAGKRSSTIDGVTVPWAI